MDHIWFHQLFRRNIRLLQRRTFLNNIDEHLAFCPWLFYRNNNHNMYFDCKKRQLRTVHRWYSLRYRAWLYSKQVVPLLFRNTFHFHSQCWLSNSHRAFCRCTCPSHIYWSDNLDRSSISSPDITLNVHRIHFRQRIELHDICQVRRSSTWCCQWDPSAQRAISCSRSCPLWRNYKIVLWIPCILGSSPCLSWVPPNRSSPASTSRLHRWRSCRRYM